MPIIKIDKKTPHLLSLKYAAGKKNSYGKQQLFQYSMFTFWIIILKPKKDHKRIK